uniref:CACTA en-spm transposon protein n=1 Tax=Cucumis melo TaxID=3656 RepID=A0A9I9E1U9_CUCME
MSTGIMSLSYPRHNFLETDAMFLEFEDELDNLAGGSSSVGDNAKSERHVTVHGRISMKIAPVQRNLFPHTPFASQPGDMRVHAKIFPIRYLKWADIGREYIEDIKGDLQRFFVLDFNDQAMNRFFEHQMLNTFKEFQDNCHRHFKKYSDPEEARTNSPNILVGRHED